VAYIQLLIDQGMSVDAEEELVSLANKQSHHIYWDLFKQLNHPNPAKAMRFIEQEIKKHPNDGELYSVLGNIAFNVSDFELAHKALSKALDLGAKPADKALMANVLEKQNNYEQANMLYKGLIH